MLLPWNAAFGARAMASAGGGASVELPASPGALRLALLSPAPDRLTDLFKVWDKEPARQHNKESDNREPAGPASRGLGGCGLTRPCGHGHGYRSLSPQTALQSRSCSNTKRPRFCWVQMPFRRYWCRRFKRWCGTTRCRVPQSRSGSTGLLRSPRGDGRQGRALSRPTASSSAITAVE